jgi:hypothetical protein
MGTPGAAGSGAGPSGLVHFEDTDGNTYDIPAQNADAFKQLMREEYVQIVGEPELQDVPLWAKPSPPPDPNKPSMQERMDEAAFGPDAGVEFGPVEPYPDNDAGAYDLPMPGRDSAGPAGPVDAKLQQSRDELAASDARRAGQKDLTSGDRTHGRGVYSNKIEPPGQLETIGRSWLDVAGAGFQDEGAGLGGMWDELTTGTPVGKYTDSLLRNVGIDIPMRVERQVQTPAHAVADNAEQRVEVPAGVETQTTMGYKEKPKGYAKEGAVTKARQATPRTETQGRDAPEQGALSRYGDAFMGPKQQYAQRDEEAFDAHPVTRFVSGIVPNVAQTIAGRWLMSGASAADEAAGAVARAGPGVGKWIERSAAGAKDVLTNRGSLAQAGAQGFGHAEGRSFTEWLLSGMAGAGGEVAGGLAAVGPAEIALTPPRWLGRDTERKLMDPNSSDAHLHNLARNAGAEYEMSHKPAKGRVKRPLTGARGLRPGEGMQKAIDEAKARGSGDPVDLRRTEAATRVAGVLDDNSQRLLKNLEDTRGDYYVNPEGAQGISGDDFFTGVEPEMRAELVAKLRQLRVSDAELHGREAFTPEGSANARVFDRLLEYVDNKAKTHKSDRRFGEEADYADLARRLRSIQETEGNFRGGRVIADNHAQAMREHEAHKTQFGIPVESKGVNRTPGGADVEAIKTRLKQGPSTSLSDATRELELGDPPAGVPGDRQTGELLRDWAGLDAQHRLMADAEDAEGLGVARGGKAGKGVSVQIPDLWPGMRAAGMQNLGLNSQAGARALGTHGFPQATPEDVEAIPEDLKWLVHLLGYDKQSPADLQKLVQMIESQQP